MRWAIVVLVFLGLLAATSAALLVASFGRKKNPEVSQVEILVATRALPAQTILNAGMIMPTSVATSEAPASFYTNAVQIVGKMLIAPVAEGQAISPDSFGDRESGAKFAAAISAGMVAVSISPKDYASLEGLLYPGCLVDVIFTMKPSGNQQPVAVTLLQGVHVLAIGKHSVVTPKNETDNLAPQRPGDNSKVTLQLTPRQAKVLNLAMENGSVSLALRNSLDPTTADDGSISLDELFASEKAPDPALTPIPTHGNPTTQATQTPPGWDMVLIQGGVKEKRSWPVPDDK